MSQENVERMRGAMVAFNQRDGAALDGFLATDAEIVPVRAALEGTTYRGRDAGTQYCGGRDPELGEPAMGCGGAIETATAGFLPWDTFVARGATAVPPLTRGQDGSPTSATV